MQSFSNTWGQPKDRLIGSEEIELMWRLLRLVEIIEKNPMVMERDQIPFQVMMNAPTPIWHATASINLATTQVIFQVKTQEPSWCNMDSVLLNRL